MVIKKRTREGLAGIVDRHTCRRARSGHDANVAVAAPKDSSLCVDCYLSELRAFFKVVASHRWDADSNPRNYRRANMSPLPPHQDRVERRDRALALRRKIKAVAGAGGVAGVGLVGYFVAVGAPKMTAIPAVSAVRTVTSVRTVTTVITVGDDGVISKTTTTTLSPGTATAGTAASAVTVTGGSTVVKKP